MPPTSAARRACAAAALVLLATVTGCAGGTGGGGSTWVAQPDYQGNAGPTPNNPVPSLPGTGVPQPGQPGSTPSSGAAATDPNVVASKLAEPTGLVVLPDGTALVGERRSGNIFRVQPQAGQPAVLVQTLAGVDGGGDGGLLDLAVSPTFNQDGLVYAYLTTATDNRVVHFALGKAPSPVISGIPKGATDNAGRIAFDATGALLTGTGDAGQPALAASGSSLAGKILRTNDTGRPLPGNPVPGSPVYARGLRTVDGLCVDAQLGTRIAVSAGHPDEVNLIKAGADYGWPHAGSASLAPAKTLPASAAGGGGCALAQGHLVIATAAGKALLATDVSKGGTIGAFSTALHGSYGRLRTVVAASDGALWLTTRNRDGHGTPIADDDRVIRISASDDSSNPVV